MTQNNQSKNLTDSSKVFERMSGLTSRREIPT